MSDSAPASPAAHEPPADGGVAVSNPEFDRQEISQFGQSDGHAITVIGKMLVGFFFYSLIVMAVVGAMTWARVGQSPPAADHATHEEGIADF